MNSSRFSRSNEGGAQVGCQSGNGSVCEGKTARKVGRSAREASTYYMQRDEEATFMIQPIDDQDTMYDDQVGARTGEAQQRNPKGNSNCERRHHVDRVTRPTRTRLRAKESATDGPEL